MPDIFDARAPTRAGRAFIDVPAEAATLSLSERDSALWYTDLLRAALSQTDDVAEAVAVADHAYANAAALGLDAEGFWHGPTPPGPGWVHVATGDKGGMVWANRAPGRPVPAYKGSQEPRQPRQAKPKPATAPATAPPPASPPTPDAEVARSVAANPVAAQAVAAASGPSAADIVSAALAAKPSVRHGDMMYVSELRRLFPGVAKGAFDRAVMAMGRQGVIDLHAHAGPQHLTPEQRDAETVFDPEFSPDRLAHSQGTGHYVGVVFRDEALRLARRPGAALSMEEAFSSEPPGPGWIFCGAGRWVRGRRDKMTAEEGAAAVEPDDPEEEEAEEEQPVDD